MLNALHEFIFKALRFRDRNCPGEYHRQRTKQSSWCRRGLRCGRMRCRIIIIVVVVKIHHFNVMVHLHVLFTHIAKILYIILGDISDSGLSSFVMHR